MMTHLSVDTVVWNARAMLFVGTKPLQGTAIRQKAYEVRLLQGWTACAQYRALSIIRHRPASLSIDHRITQPDKLNHLRYQRSIEIEGRILIPSSMR